jgi:hypothetical protein
MGRALIRRGAALAIPPAGAIIFGGLWLRGFIAAPHLSLHPAARIPYSATAEPNQEHRLTDV